ncbi:PREDICTED: LOW QUALITY PROTEIN: sushi, von Willebrand factor type A, EGF and pentraxin domain-containing protein 1-like [Priapulus caudatus]|uniref:LOW QUALITY PROTEIN: sushi, von Willebrand factor type A, EGF and pentraxin domain-containing protein 1-like n=1 Tax=Priapulus caudatus TaxID=37621 RepID=A0ABM1DUN3_PRICU|nr:PREDICTED: LOW QUALITY PROTEIN: sushi, von Willebrand factor type A, EGF and pentraxin domain-containing protein 1-like [Priapulus caudatus]
MKCETILVGLLALLHATSAQGRVDKNLRSCSPNPCVHGTCINRGHERSGGRGIGMARCVCDEGWSGSRCSIARRRTTGGGDVAPASLESGSFNCFSETPPSIANAVFTYISTTDDAETLRRKRQIALGRTRFRRAARWKRQFKGRKGVKGGKKVKGRKSPRPTVVVEEEEPVTASSARMESQTIFAEYYCNEGFFMRSGSRQASCSRERGWLLDDTPECVSECEHLTLINGQVTKTSDALYAGVTVYFVCSEGFLLVGDASSECQADGTWSSSVPECRITCGRPSVSANSHVDWSGNVAKYSCAEGYTLVGQATITCMDNGEWEHATPECRGTEVVCSRPRAPTGGSVRWSRIGGEIAPGSTATYSCGDGLTLVGQATITCLDNGEWEHATPECRGTEVVCSRPSAPTGGTVRWSRIGGEIAPGSTATYSCEDGLTLVGQAETTCMDNGEWEHATPECRGTEVICSRPSAPTGGSVRWSRIGGEIAPGSTATYSCEDGLTLVGQATITCMNNGEWEHATPECRETEVVCSRPSAPTGGSVRWSRIGGEIAPGSTATYSCEDGLTLVGQATITCLDKGEWEHATPECRGTEVVCSRPSAPTGGSVRWSRIGGEIAPGSTATYSCEDGLTLVGQATISCLDNGEWEHATPECRGTEVVCSRPSAPTGGSVRWSRIGGEIAPGSTATYSCEDDLILVGQATTTCLDNGEWQHPEPGARNSVPCHLSELPNGAILPTRLTADGAYRPDEVVGFGCELGYPDRRAELRCNGRRWCGQERSDMRAGGLWTANHDTAKRMEKLWAESSSYGSITARWNAERDTKSGTATVRCSVTPMRVMGELGFCVIVQCGPPPAVSSGYYMEMSARNRHGITTAAPLAPINGKSTWTSLLPSGVVTYSCENGFLLVGVTENTCMDDGEWEHPEPRCEETRCLPLERIPNGHFTHSSHTDGAYRPDEVVGFGCELGYNLIGSAELRCMGDDVWTGTPPTCELVDCGSQLQPAKRMEKLWANRPVTAASPRWNAERDTKSRTADGSFSCDSMASGWESLDLRHRAMRAAPPAVSSGYYMEMSARNRHGITDPAVYVFDDTTHYKCDPDTTLVGDAVLTCGVDGWEGDVPRCVTSECNTPTLTVANGRMIGHDYSVGATIKYICDAGYILSGSRIRTCLPTEEWDLPLPRCEKVECPKPLRPVYGYIDGFTYGFEDTVSYRCKAGYTLQGPATRVCSVSGEWSGDNPVCVKDMTPCEQQLAPINVGFGCELGYNLIGSAELRCMGDDVWTGTPPTCELVDCGQPTTTGEEDGEIVGESSSYGSIIALECREGYEVTDGDGSLFCDSDGEWMGELGFCVIVQCGPPPAVSSGYYMELSARNRHGITDPAVYVFDDTAQYKCDR